MAVLTPEEMRRLFAEHENHMARLVKDAVEPVKEQLHRVEVQVVKTNGRVTKLEKEKLVEDAVADERARAAKEAAELVANQAAAVIKRAELSSAQKAWRVGAVVGLVSVSTPVVTAVLHSIF